MQTLHWVHRQSIRHSIVSARTASVSLASVMSLQPNSINHFVSHFKSELLISLHLLDDTSKPPNRQWEKKDSEPGALLITDTATIDIGFHQRYLPNNGSQSVCVDMHEHVPYGTCIALFFVINNCIFCNFTCYFTLRVTHNFINNLIKFHLFDISNLIIETLITVSLSSD